MIKKLLMPHKYDKKIRIGPNRDGGYVLAGDLINCERLLSIGCKNETGFEEEFLRHNQNPNIKCQIYDVEGACDLASRDERVLFSLKKIENIEHVVENSLSTIIQMDIEGGEFECLSSHSGNFQNVWQMIIEFHFYDSIIKNYNLTDIFAKLNSSFYLIHMHGNNHRGYIHSGIPQVLECTYVNKGLFKTIPEKETSAFPIKGLDFPNSISKKEMLLDWWI